MSFERIQNFLIPTFLGTWLKEPQRPHPQSDLCMIKFTIERRFLLELRLIHRFLKEFRNTKEVSSYVGDVEVYGMSRKKAKVLKLL